MSEVYVGYFLGIEDLVIFDYVGWSNSEYVTRMFLKQFNVDTSVYTPYITTTDNKDPCPELLAVDVDVIDETRIWKTCTSNQKENILMTDRLFSSWVDIIDSAEDNPIQSYFMNGVDENSMYNRMFAAFDMGLIRPTKLTPVIKDLIKLMYEKYQTDMINLYGETYEFDLIEFMLRKNYLTCVI